MMLPSLFIAVIMLQVAKNNDDLNNFNQHKRNRSGSDSITKSSMKIFGGLLIGSALGCGHDGK